MEICVTFCLQKIVTKNLHKIVKIVLHKNHHITIDNHHRIFYINGRNSLSSVLERVEIVKFLHHTRLWCEY